MDLNLLYRQYYPSIYRLCFRITGCKEDSLDVVQDAFIKYHESSLKKIDNPKAWLYRVASNLSINLVNRRKKSREYENSFENIKYPLLEEEVLKQEEIKKVRGVLNSLRKKDQVVLMLYQDSMSYDDMAYALKIKRSSVGKTISRAQRRFAEKWEALNDRC